MAYTIYVVAQSESEAEEEAVDHVRDEEPYESSATVTQEPGQIYSDWTDSIPYGHPDFVNDRSCLEVLEALKTEPPTAAELEQAGQGKMFGVES